MNTSSNNPLDPENFAASLREAQERYEAAQQERHIFYTVLTDKEGFPVKYLDPETYRRKTFSGPFSDPGEASQEFQVQIGKDASCYLDNKQFQGKARALAALRRNTAKHREMV